MLAIFSILLLGAIFYYLAVPPLLGVSVVLLALPLIVIPIEPVFGFVVSFVVGLLVLTASMAIIGKKKKIALTASGVIELFSLAPLYVCLRRITSQWPEFYNIGEHIRDFAILSAITRDPAFTKDPWLDSLNIYYYTYWYRFGYIFKKVFGYSTAQTYHFLICFCLAFLFALVLRVSRIIMRFSWKESLFVTAITVFGSNILGLTTASSDGFWWGPSRAVAAGITEFPSWSFVLGDLHPHYLSLVFLPLILLVVGELSFPFKSWKNALIPVGNFLWVAVWFVYGANSWDVVGFAILTLPLLAAIYFGQRERTDTKVSLLSFTLCFSIGILAIIFSPKPGGNPLVLKRVLADSPQVPVEEFLMHWGLPFLSLLIGLIIALFERLSFLSLLVCLLPVALAVGMGSTLALLQVFLVISALQVYFTRSISIPLALSIGAILVLTFTELFFFDDSYGGINERLNTIFKFYYFCWIPLTFGALCFFCQEVRRLPREFRSKEILIPSGLAVVVIMLAFFIQLSLGNGGRKVVLGKYVEPRSEGLSSVEQEVQGSAEAIRKLRTLPPQLRVLERAEPAYSSSANLCSLSDHNCYIGWRNHLMIQYKSGLDEYDRREKVAATIYRSDSCTEKLTQAKAEQIGAIVIGPREKEIYPLLKDEDFNCFSEKPTFGRITLAVP